MPALVTSGGTEDITCEDQEQNLVRPGAVSSILLQQYLSSLGFALPKVMTCSGSAETP